MWDEDPFQLLRDDFSDDFYRIKVESLAAFVVALTACL